MWAWFNFHTHLAALAAVIWFLLDFFGIETNGDSTHRNEVS